MTQRKVLHSGDAWYALKLCLDGSFLNWAQVGFDAFAILLAIVNALDRPYRQSTDVLSSLRRDGAAWFIVRAEHSDAQGPYTDVVESRVYSVRF